MCKNFEDQTKEFFEVIMHSEHSGCSTDMILFSKWNPAGRWPLFDPNS